MMSHPLQGGEAMKSIGFIGAGKVSFSMGKYLSLHEIPVTGYYDVNPASADEAATFTDSRRFPDEKELIAASDCIFIATPDDAIITVWNTIKTMDIKNRIIGIFSGSLSSSLFSGIGMTGAAGISIHPMYAFSDKFSDYRQLHTAKLTMEGESSAVAYFRELFETLGHTVSVIDSATSPSDGTERDISTLKMRYHCAASVASNLMIGLYEMSLSMLTDCGFSEEEAGSFLSPLIEKNVSAMLTTGPEKALTGPIERGDTETVKHHLEVMTPEERAVYLPLARRLTEIAKRKNPERDYRSMEELIQESREIWENKTQS